MMANLTKPQWRDRMKARLNALTAAEYQDAAFRLEEYFRDLKMAQNAAVVMLYFAVNREAATANLITGLLSRGRRVVLPVCTAGCNLVAKEIQSLAEVRPTGKFGLFEPAGAAPEVGPDLIELAVVPGLAFDRSGNRLGHGKGYYDRFLRGAGFGGVKLGLAYDFQMVEQLPAAEYDVRMDVVLTPNGLYQC
jgi:5-formyltetrahydrofolate cyclo-ligase